MRIAIFNEVSNIFSMFKINEKIVTILLINFHDLYAYSIIIKVTQILFLGYANIAFITMVLIDIDFIDKENITILFFNSNRLRFITDVRLKFCCPQNICQLY